MTWEMLVCGFFFAGLLVLVYWLAAKVSDPWS